VVEGRLKPGGKNTGETNLAGGYAAYRHGTAETGLSRSGLVPALLAKEKSGQSAGARLAFEIGRAAAMSARGRGRALAGDGQRRELVVKRMSGRTVLEQALGAQEEGLVHGPPLRLGVLKAR